MLLEFSREIKAVDTDFLCAGGKNGNCADAGDENVSLHEAFPGYGAEGRLCRGGGGRPGNSGKYQESLNKYIGQADFDRFVPKAKPEMVMKCGIYAERPDGGVQRPGAVWKQRPEKRNRGLSADVCRSVSIKEKTMDREAF